VVANDVKIAYLPTTKVLEGIYFNDEYAEVELRNRSILKRFSLALDLQKLRHRPSSEGAVPLTNFKVQISCQELELTLTNRQLHQLKDFNDRFLKYHK